MALLGMTEFHCAAEEPTLTGIHRFCGIVRAYFQCSANGPYFSLSPGEEWAHYRLESVDLEHREVLLLCEGRRLPLHFGSASTSNADLTVPLQPASDPPIGLPLTAEDQAYRLKYGAQELNRLQLERRASQRKGLKQGSPSNPVSANNAPTPARDIIPSEIQAPVVEQTHNSGSP